MSAAQFTPGPWEVHARTYSFKIVPVGEQFALADCNQWRDSEGPHPNRETAEANARLIVAAPDGYDAAGAFIMAAINEYDIPEDADEGWIVDTLGHGLGDAYLKAVAFRAKARGEESGQ